MRRKRMRVARLYDIDDIRIEEAPVPQIGPDDMLVAMRASGICSGDLMPWYIRRKAPLVLGHEPAGVVVEVGEQVQNFRPGDRVFVHHHAPCFQCSACLRGDFVHCPTWRSSRIDPGGMAEYFRVPASNLADTLLLPMAVSFADGALVEPVACVVKALRRARIRPGDTVLVIGLGIMGQLLVALGRHFGAGHVLASDFIAARRNQALRHGATAVADPGAVSLPAWVAEHNEGRLADVVIVGPPLIQAMEEALQAVAAGGTVVWFSPAEPGQQLSIEPFDLYFREITIVPSYSCGPRDTREALRLIAAGTIRANDFVSHRFRLEETPHAYAQMRAGGETIKALIEHEEEPGR